MAKAPKPLVPNKSLARKAPKIDPLPAVHIYCEGSVTEPAYLNAYYRTICKEKRAILFPIQKGVGTPKKIVQKCVEKMQELRRDARKDSSFEKFTSVWAVFDIDDHPYIDEAIALAKKEKINVAISNPCIEVWGLMHAKIYEAPLTRHQAQAELAAIMPHYHHEKSPLFNWAWCESKVDDAISNSDQGLQRREDENNSFPRGNPTSNFHHLLRALNPPKIKIKDKE